MPNVRKDVLPNGMTIVTESMSSVRSVSVGIWLRTGARQERIEDNGISHFIEHMLFKGTKNRSAEDIARAADSIGGHLDAFTAKETTNYSIKVLDEHLPQAFGILSDLVKNPFLNPSTSRTKAASSRKRLKWWKTRRMIWCTKSLPRLIGGGTRWDARFWVLEARCADSTGSACSVIPPALCAQQSAGCRRGQPQARANR